MNDDPGFDSRGDGSNQRSPARCSYCGSRIDTTRWYPIVTEIVDETVLLNSFCAESCSEAWKETRLEE